MANDKKSEQKGEKKILKSEMTPFERFEFNERLVAQVRVLVQNLPMEVLGFIDLPAAGCCDGGGTSCIVRYEELVGNPPERKVGK